MIVTNAILTAYCACRLCCGPSAPQPTASGVWPKPNHTVAASLPFGTIIVINGHRYRVEDRLAPRYANRIDIFMRSHEEARKFGIRTNTVKILKP